MRWVLLYYIRLILEVVRMTKATGLQLMGGEMLTSSEIPRVPIFQLRHTLSKLLMAVAISMRLLVNSVLALIRHSVSSAAVHSICDCIIRRALRTSARRSIQRANPIQSLAIGRARGL